MPGTTLLNPDQLAAHTFDVLRANLPQDQHGDAVFAHLIFLHVHRRLPTDGMLVLDVLHRLKTSGALQDPLRVMTTDKELVKDFIRARVGEQYNVPTLQVLRSAAALDDYAFPEAACIKPTHMSGEVQFSRPGAPPDRAQIRSWFGRSHYLRLREANYRTLVPKVIVEPLVFGGADLLDYKVFCCNGVPRVIQVDFDRKQFHTRRYFTAQWQQLDLTWEYQTWPGRLERPANLAEMLAVAAALAAPFNLVRVDLYSDGTRCCVGELTHCPNGALGRFGSPAEEEHMSRLLFG